MVDEDIVLTVIVTGHINSRKGGVVQRFITGKYLEKFDPTIEDSYHCKRKIGYNNEIKTVTFSILDVLLINDKYKVLAHDWTRESRHFILVYSIDSYASLIFLEDIIKHIARVHEIYEEPVYVTIVGNNCHLRNSKDENGNNSNDKLVTREDGLNFVNQILGRMCDTRGIDFDDPITKQIEDYVSISFWEVSDKTGFNIEKPFINSYVLHKMFEQFKRNANAFKMLDTNRLLLFCFGFNRFGKDCEKVIPKGITTIIYQYLDGLFWNDNPSSSNQCCCTII